MKTATLVAILTNHRFIRKNLRLKIIVAVTPHLFGYEDAIITYIRRAEIPSHMYAKYISTVRNQSMDAQW